MEHPSILERNVELDSFTFIAYMNGIACMNGYSCIGFKRNPSCEPMEVVA